jgi:hypothetical protein
VALLAAIATYLLLVAEVVVELFMSQVQLYLVLIQF